MMMQNLCRCCLTETCYKDLSNEYYYGGNKELYSKMLVETFNIKICDTSSKCLICEECIMKLRAATAFRKQVVDAIETLKSALLSDYSEEYTETKDDFDAHSPSCLDGDVKIERLEDSVSWDDQHVDREGDIFVIKMRQQCEDKKVSREKPEILTKAKRVVSTTRKKISKCMKNKQKEKETQQKSSTEEQKNLKENSLKLLLNSNICPFDSLRTKFKCFSCRETFINIMDLREHTKSHSNFKIVRCRFNSLRGASFKSVDISNLKCKLCSETCNSLEQLKDHLIRHDVKFHDCGSLLIPYKLEKDFNCLICHQVFNTFTRLSIHMNCHYTNNVCEICGVSFISRLSLRTHINAVHREKKCSKCSDIFPTEYAKVKHMRTAHKAAPSKRYCLLCNKTFRYTHSLYEHRVKEHGVERQVSECLECGKKFISQQNLRIHVRSVHKRERKYPCGVCSMAFFTKFDLRRHEVTHEDVRSFSCSHCDSKFKSKDSWRRHLKRQH